MAIKGVILDWAGTTVDFGCMAPVQAFVDAFQASKLAVTMEETRKPMGMSKRDHIETMLNMPRISQLFQQTHAREFTQEDIEIIYAAFNERLFATLAHHAELKPHLLETMQTLNNMGIKVGSTTGYTTKMMEVVTQIAKQAGYEPECWLSAESVGGFGRPYPYMIFKNIQLLGLSSVSEVLKVGDTESDILEGQAAGVRTVGIIEGSSEMGLSWEEWMHCTKDEQQQLSEKTRLSYQKYGADFVIHNLSQLPRLIECIV